MADKHRLLPPQTVEHRDHVVDRLGDRERPRQRRGRKPALLKGRDPKARAELGGEPI
jgi:hypothetical protein